MAIDLSGINNENEFYAHHYLSTLLENDLKGVMALWKEREEQEADYIPPDRALGNLYRPYFQARSRLQGLRNPLVQREQQGEILQTLLELLGFPWQPREIRLEDGLLCPVLATLNDPAGAPQLWVLEMPFPGEEDQSLFELALNEGDTGEAPVDGMPGTVLDLINRHIFAQEEPPRWLILAGFYQVILVDRSKWAQKRHLRFDLAEILGRREASTLRATAALLHRDSICPESGPNLLDTLDEKAHKHAFAVSEDLKYAAREAVELLGNEVIYYLREVRKERIFERPELAAQLSSECLRYLYRLLFLFYLEARPELGFAPLKSDAYRSGYSLEALRELEMRPLNNERERNGYYLHHSLQTLFDLVYQGVNFEVKEGKLDFEDNPLSHEFRMAPLKCHLFDPELTPLLKGVKFRNRVLQRVVELLSLSRPARSGKRRERRGRISYAQLGINQLGAVYEGLLSYAGFFAQEDLYEVKKAGTDPTELEAAYFVPGADLPLYKEDEKIYNQDGSLRKHPRGSFIYRLSGRQRQKSASYYTPEVLTQCLVKYALKTLLKEEMSAEEILRLTVCEPAMGSGAFLNEAVNQLAEAYLQRRQKELGETLGPEQYLRERQKVKMYLADNNVFGVDLNPTAIELAEVSLWLNSIYAGSEEQAAFVPWFGMQLNSGNSLIGARREVFEGHQLGRERQWLSAVPQAVSRQDSPSPTSVYHFLLPDEGMAFYNNNVIKAMAGEALKRMAAWRKDFCAPFSPGQLSTLQSLSRVADELWAEQAIQQQRIRERTTDPIAIYGRPAKAGRRPSTTREKDKIFDQEMHSKGVRNASPYRRLKLVMDYWCALWFWPLEKADLLPSRDEFLLEVKLILEGQKAMSGVVGEQTTLFPTTQPQQLALQLLDKHGFVDLAALQDYPRLRLVRELATRYRFFHWELEYADLFAERGGFDLVLGNPPWVKLEWSEGGILGDFEPLYDIRKFSASRLNKLREETLEKHQLHGAYLGEFEEAEGAQNFLNARQNYPALQGMQSNLYKCFLPRAWGMVNQQGVSGFVHPEGVYDDPKGGAFREQLYPRLRYHFQFQNEFGLFEGTNDHGRLKFSLNVYGAVKSEGDFTNISWLFHPKTIDECFQKQVSYKVEGIKNSDNQWNIVGHPDRLVPVNSNTLALFAKLYDPPGTPAVQARLPVVHSRQVLAVLEKFAAQERRLGDLVGEYTATVMWDETNAQKAGIIRRETRFPEHPGEWIVSGPHFYVGNPFNKTPREACTQNSHYDVLDLTELPPDYLPRTNYVPAAPPAVYQQRTPKVPWGDNRGVTEYYRLAFRKMLSQSGERTMIPAILPRYCGHVDGTFSLVFKDNSMLISAFSLFSSLSFDFFLKTTGKANFRNELAVLLPIVESEYAKQMTLRSLLLHCLSQSYTELWKG
ncbi:MAG TPA: hypothetical protein PLG66_04795, partial [Calditrichia bacterium]|nr:hypothetical protein [Calditrichia bacterium]